MYFACKSKDQNGDAFIGMGKRLKGTDMDRAVGKTELIDGEGFQKDYIGYRCSYAIEYVEDIVFAPLKCKNNVSHLISQQTIYHNGVVWEYEFINVFASVSVIFRVEIKTYSDNQKKLFGKIKRLNKKVLVTQKQQTI